jgi:DNA-binding MurR/RpiR family transcriptional regulator
MAMTPNARRILDYMKQNFGTEMTKQEIAAALGVSVSAVVGTTNSLIKKGFATERQETTLDEKNKEKVIKYVVLTDEGNEFDPDAEAK